MLSLEEERITIEAGHGDRAQASEAIPATLNGEGISLAFNPTFLQEGINSINSRYVRLSYTTANKPAVLMPEGENGETDETFKILLMPIRLGTVN